MTRSEGGRLLGDQRARKIHFIAAAVRGSDKVSWSHAPRNIRTNAKTVTSCNNAFVTNILLASRSEAERIV